VQQEFRTVLQEQRYAMSRAVAASAVAHRNVGDALERLRVGKAEIPRRHFEERLCAVHRRAALERRKDRRH
jgi:hypothetical protein